MAYLSEIEMTKVDCGKCGASYAINARFHEHKKENGGYWNCPYCQCSWGFSEDGSEAQTLRDELARKQLQHQRDEISKSYQKMRERVKNGVCPCCNRTFQTLCNI